MTSVIFSGQAQAGGNQTRIELARLRSQVEELQKKLAAVHSVVSYHLPSAGPDLTAALNTITTEAQTARQGGAGPRQPEPARANPVQGRFRP